MFKSTKTAVIAIALVMGVLALAPAGASAQTTATMPVFYNSSGQVVNTGITAALPAGYYYLSPGGQQVYYYGNGTFYNPSTGTYGGSVGNPFGVSGASLGYSTTYADPNNVYTYGSNSFPGVPNTGVGGEALATWVTLILSAAIVLSGITYLVATRRQVGR